MKPRFAFENPIQMDNATGRIAMQWGGWYDETDPLPHIGMSRVKAEALLTEDLGNTVFPNFQGGYTITSGYLDEESHLIVVICTPKRGVAPVSGQTTAWLDENSILTDRASECP